jgi:predicted PolB exonuclease-like 3'-5' exonuclease
LNLFVFDIETVPDVEGGKRIYNLEHLTDTEAAQALYALRRQETGGSEFLRLHLQRIVAISVVLRTKDKMKVWSLGQEDSSEADLIARFFDGLAKYSPTLISWNGSGFDLPVLHYRALRHGIAAPRYWEMGENDPNFKWNNYLNRYHYRHTDLMDILAGYQARANAPLDQIATLLGFPGKMGMSGDKVWDYFQRGEIAAIRDYCETDVLNTYLVYLRFEQMRGKYDAFEYEAECEHVKEMLRNEHKNHLTEFLASWQQNRLPTSIAG